MLRLLLSNMVLNAEAKFRKRAREALKEGRDFEARGETNKRILEEVRAELEEEASPPPDKRRHVATVKDQVIEEDAVMDMVNEDDAVRDQVIEDDALIEVALAQQMACEVVFRAVCKAMEPIREQILDKEAEAFWIRMRPVIQPVIEEERRQKEAAACLCVLGYAKGVADSFAERGLAVIRLQCEELKQRDRAQNTDECIISGGCCEKHGPFCTSVMPEQTYMNTWGWMRSGPQPGPHANYEKAEQAAKQLMKHAWIKAWKGFMPIMRGQSKPPNS